MERKSRIVANKSTLSRSLAKVTFIAMLGMTAYEATKQLLFPRVTLWASHAMTIFVATVGCGLAAFLVTKRQAKLLDATRQAEDMYRNLVENAVEGVFQTTPDGGYLRVNPALARMYGYETPEALMSAVKDIGHQVYVNPDRRDEFKRLIAEQGIVEGFEYQVYRKDREKIWLSENARAVRDPQGTVLYYEGTVEEITERKRLEEHLRHALKMEAVGRLAGGVAHDFNNLLTVIQGHSEILQQLPDLPARAFRSTEAIEKAARTAASVTRQLLAFSRMQVIEPKMLDLNLVLAEMGKILPRLIREDIELQIKPAASLGTVLADEGQIEQVIMNLVINARDAMPEGGKLIIETRNVELDQKYASGHPSAVPGRFAMLAVSDSGQGMDPERQARIFEPFFTTKELGKGTGLGLATVYGIVKQSSGCIWVYSELGLGTTFKIYLPQIEKPAAEATQPDAALSVSPGTETILLAEDQDDIRALAVEALKSHGYTILQASNGSEALEIAERHQGTLDLVVTDIVMPKMGGRELAECLKRRLPKIKVLFTSGYTEYCAREQRMLDGSIFFLQKPFSLTILLRKVRDALDAPSFLRANRR
jgi:PAS domain S-box-containing protein